MIPSLERFLATIISFETTAIPFETDIRCVSDSFRRCVEEEEEEEVKHWEPYWRGKMNGGVIGQRNRQSCVFEAFSRKRTGCLKMAVWKRGGLAHIILQHLNE
jgi:hypothetical protein